MTLYETHNGMRIGDRVEYETDINPDTGKSEIIPGVITALLAPDMITIRNSVTNTEFNVSTEYVTRVFDCKECEDTGKHVIPAHQHGGDIVDEQEIPCHCPAGKCHKQHKFRL
jgi:hypothetical protein